MLRSSSLGLVGLVGVVVGALASSACSNTTCDDPMPGAVYCERGAEDAEPDFYRLTATDGVVFFTNGQDVRRVLDPSQYEVITSRRTEPWFTSGPAGKVCWSWVSTVECADARSGGLSTWLAAKGESASTLRLPGTTSFVASYSDGARSRFVIVSEGGVEQRALGEVASAGGGGRVFGDALYVPTFGSKPQIVRLPLDGSGPTSVTPRGECSLVESDGALHCISSTQSFRVAPTVGDSTPLAKQGFVRQLGDTLARVEGDRVVAVDALGEELRVLWQRPAGYEGEYVRDVASDGHDLFIALGRSPCSYSGKDKQSVKTCDGSTGRLDIVRAPLR